MSKYEVILTSQGTCWKEAIVEVEAEDEAQAIKLAEALDDVEYNEVEYDAMDYSYNDVRLIKQGNSDVE